MSAAVAAAHSFITGGHPWAMKHPEWVQEYRAIPFSMPAQFPATFGGDRTFYGLALFSLMIVSITAAMALMEIVRLYRAYQGGLRSPAQMNRLSLGAFLFTTIMLAFPPAVFNLLWGEVTPDTLLTIRRIQIGCQAAAYIPFMFGMALLAMSRHAITYQLVRMPLPIDLWANRQQLLRSARVGALCFAIAALVAYAK